MKVVIWGLLIKAKELSIYLDRCLPAHERENLERYFKTEFLSLFKEIPKITINHEASHNNNRLQVTDFICGAFGCKYNQENAEYTALIHNRISTETNAE